MKLEKVYFHGFGQWQEKEFLFAPGWNIIYAPNEWGKTTLLHGMLALLYGMKKEGVTGRRYVDDYDRYYPWTGTRYGGMIEYSLSKERYRIERELSKDRESVSVYIADTGRDVTTQFPQDPRKERPILPQQIGLRRDLFEQVTIIRSEGVGQGNEIIERLSPTAKDGEDSGTHRGSAALKKAQDELGRSERATTKPYGKAWAQLEELEQRRKAAEKNYRQISEWTLELSQLSEPWNQVEAYWRSLLDAEAIWEKEKELERQEVQRRLQSDKAVLMIEKLEERIHSYEEIGLLKELTLGQLQELDREIESVRAEMKRDSQIQTSMQQSEALQQKLDELQALLYSEQQVWNDMEHTSRLLMEIELRYHREPAPLTIGQATSSQTETAEQRLKTYVNRLSGSLSIFVIGLGLIPLYDMLGLLLAGIGAVTASWSGIQLVLLRQERVQKGHRSDNDSVRGNPINQTKDQEKSELYSTWVEVEGASMEEMALAFEELLEIQQKELDHLKEELMQCRQKLESICRQYGVQQPRELFSIYQKAKEKELHYQYLLKQRQDLDRKIRDQEQKLDQWGGLESRKRWEEELLHLRGRSGNLWDPRYEAEAGAARETEVLSSEVDTRERQDHFHIKGEQIRQQKEETANQREALLQRKTQLESSIDTLQHQEIGMSELISLIDAKKAECEQVKEELEALILAEEVLRDVSEFSRRKLVKQLSIHSSEMISTVTDQKYNDVRVDTYEQFSLSVMEPRLKELKTVDQLSKGTIDQFHLAMRVALNKALSMGVALPLFLDDALVHFDDERLQRSLTYLDRLAEKHQLFYFTCRKSEVELLSRLGVKTHSLINENL
jgi:DNA repair exonuclease SbcCD ATPase subunit